jgi:hypothetical protein
MKWDKHSEGYWKSDTGYEIHYGKVTSGTRPELHPTVCLVINPQGELLVVVDNLTDAQNYVSMDVIAIPNFKDHIRETDWTSCIHCGGKVLFGSYCSPCMEKQGR